MIMKKHQKIASTKLMKSRNMRLLCLQLIVVTPILMSSCIGFVSQEMLAPSSRTIQLPDGELNVSLEGGPGTLYSHAPWKLILSFGAKRNSKCKAIGFTACSVISDVQKEEYPANVKYRLDPTYMVASFYGKRLIKHPGEGRTITINFISIIYYDNEKQITSHTVTFKPIKRHKDIITYNPFLDIT